MKKFLIPFILAFSLIFIQESYSQNEQPDTTEVEEEFEFEEPNFDLEDVDIEFELWDRPVIAIDYGYTLFKSKEINTKLKELGNVRIKFATRSSDTFKEDYLIKTHSKYLLLNHFSKELWKKEESNKLDSKNWQFGVGTDKGYGYSFGSSAVIFHNSSNFIWTRVEADLSKVNNIQDSSYLALFNESFRFGQSKQAGIEFQLVPLLSLDVNYEIATVFPRHLFWKHLGSFIIEEATQGIGWWFTKKVFNSTPSAGPIVNFLIKSGIAYAFYELKKEKMNWPFSSARPLTYDAVTIGLKFNF